MFREMRRSKQALTDGQCDAILDSNTVGVLATAGDEGYPYAVPLSYVHADGCIYFHCATSGHKLDAIADDPRVSLCVVDRNDLVPEHFTTHYRSVIVFGRAEIIEDAAEKRRTLELIALRYGPDDEQARRLEIDKTIDHLTMVRIVIDHMSGKQARELIGSESTDSD